MSQTTVINQTDEAIRLAVYATPVKQPNLSSIAWRLIAPPPQGGQTIVNIPNDYQVYANYSDLPEEREDPNAGNRTNIVNFSENTARFLINSQTGQDPVVSSALIEQSFNNLVPNEVRVENNFNTGVWGHITKDGDDIYAPQVIWPGGVLLEDIRASLYLAVVSEFVYKGSRLVEEEISLTQFEILEGGTAVVQGSKWDGYSISEATS